MIKTWAIIDDKTQKVVNLILLDLDLNPDWPIPDGCSLAPQEDPRVSVSDIDIQDPLV